MKPYPFAVMMIRPAKFVYNSETAVNNAFQKASDNQEQVQQDALQEFDAFVQLLKDHHVEVLVVQDTLEPHTPDSIFPNNWISTHKDGGIIYYPMYAANRRGERKQHVIDAIKANYLYTSERSYVQEEENELFLEGTGSMVLDRKKRIAYACLSPRTDKNLFVKWCEDNQYQAVYFDAYDDKQQLIYHTNVMMCVGDNYAVICLDSITNDAEREKVIDVLKKSNKTIVPISLEQMNHFAGNMLQVKNKEGVRYLVMSNVAYNSLTSAQIQILSAFNAILHPKLDTIETNGGGSARCMLAEIVLEKNKRS
jgi:hypothetical protein